MNSMTITMQAIPARRHELLQTLQDLVPLMHRERGFIDACIRMDSGDRNRLTFIEKWETQETLGTYMESDLFHILRGALKLLTSFSEITVYPGEQQRREPI